jgi:hypothetical protein
VSSTAKVKELCADRRAGGTNMPNHLKGSFCFGVDWSIERSPRSFSASATDSFSELPPLLSASFFFSSHFSESLAERVV